MSIETMKLALDWMEWFAGDDHSIRPKSKALDIAQALRQAIERAEKQEPVAGEGGALYQRMIIAIQKLLEASKEPSRWGSVGPDAEDVAWGEVTGLLTHICVGIDSPPQRQPLSDEQIQKCYETTGHYQTLRPQDRFAVFALARAIEQAHNITGEQA